MPCKADISAIEKKVNSYEGSVKEQIYKKIEKVKENQEIGIKKKYRLNEPDLWTVKVNKQRIVMVYKLEPGTPCIVIFISIDAHDRVYKNTY